MTQVVPLKFEKLFLLQNSTCVRVTSEVVSRFNDTSCTSEISKIISIIGFKLCSGDIGVHDKSCTFEISKIVSIIRSNLCLSDTIYSAEISLYQIDFWVTPDITSEISHD